MAGKKVLVRRDGCEESGCVLVACEAVPVSLRGLGNYERALSPKFWAPSPIESPKIRGWIWRRRECVRGACAYRAACQAKHASATSRYDFGNLSHRCVLGPWLWSYSLRRWLCLMVFVVVDGRDIARQARRHRQGYRVLARGICRALLYFQGRRVRIHLSCLRKTIFKLSVATLHGERYVCQRGTGRCLAPKLSRSARVPLRTNSSSVVITQHSCQPNQLTTCHSYLSCFCDLWSGASSL